MGIFSLPAEPTRCSDLLLWFAPPPWSPLRLALPCSSELATLVLATLVLLGPPSPLPLPCHHRLRRPHCRRQVCSLCQRCQLPRPLQRRSRSRCPCHRHHRCDWRLLYPRWLLRQEGS